MRVAGPQRDTVLRKSRGQPWETQRLEGRTTAAASTERGCATIPIVRSDKLPGTWPWSFCCLRPENPGTRRGDQRAGQAILVRYRVAAARQRSKPFNRLREMLRSVFGLLRDAD